MAIDLLADDEPIDLLEDYEDDHTSNGQGNHADFLHNLINQIKATQGKSTLETASNVANVFNHGVEASGLPSAARGFFKGGQNLVRGVGNLGHDIASLLGHPQSIPAIPEANFPRVQNVNPIVEKVAEFGGEAAGMLPVAKGYELLKGGMDATPFIRRIPEALKGILSGSATGAISSPDNRGAGAALGGAVSTLPEIAKIPGALKGENPYYAIQQGYDAQKDALSNAFNSITKNVEKHNINKIKLPKNLISSIKEIGPKTKRFQTFLEKAKDGDYKALRELNTELWHRGQKFSSSDLPSDHDLGELYFERRDTLNDAIANNLKKSGHPEEAEKLRKTMAGWRELQQTYHSHPTISKLVGENRKVPTTKTVLREESEQMKKIRGLHPEISKALRREKNINTAKKIAKYGVVSGLGYEGLHHLIK